MLNKVLKTLIILGILLTLVLIVVSLLTQQGIDKKKNGNITPMPTVINNAPSLNEQERLQGESDTYFNQQASLFLKKYPWFFKIPESDNFFIGFKEDNNLFYVVIYPDPKSNTPIDAQVEDLKAQVTRSLVSIGVDVSKYQFEWHVYPK